jgi:hypothetical protein
MDEPGITANFRLDEPLLIVRMSFGCELWMILPPRNTAVPISAIRHHRPLPAQALPRSQGLAD